MTSWLSDIQSYKNIKNKYVFLKFGLWIVNTFFYDKLCGFFKTSKNCGFYVHLKKNYIPNFGGQYKKNWKSEKSKL